MHDIISDILDWDEAHKMYVVGEGETGERYGQRLEPAAPGDEQWWFWWSSLEPIELITEVDAAANKIV